MLVDLSYRFFIIGRVKRVQSGCWEWQGNITPNGYGAWYGLKGPYEERLAHRISYRAFTGPIPAGLQIDHLCRNRCCVNPAHLEAVTRKVNILRGESSSAQNARKTHCPKGHPYEQGNIYRLAQGTRICRQCAIDRQRAIRVKDNPDIQPANALKTHCARGHEYSDDNTLWLKRGGRMCRACHRENQKMYKKAARMIQRAAA